MDHSKSAPFHVVVRCRMSNARERQASQLRFPGRADTGFSSVFCQGNRVCVVDPDASNAAALVAVKHQEPDMASASSSAGPAAAPFAGVMGETRRYEYHSVFDATASNQQVYQATALPLVRAVRDGYNASCFAYGMTGAGKTHTMLGTPLERGICGLAATDLFSGFSAGGGEEGETIDDGFCIVPTVSASYLEIYNEKLCDLLAPAAASSSSVKTTAVAAASKSASLYSARDLDIVEDPVKGICVPHATEVPVRTAEELECLLETGNEKRTMASTSSNVVSSRSHAILMLTVRRRRIATASPRASAASSKGVEMLQGKLCLVDLAGSERASVEFPHGSKHERRLEGANINRSLLALGNCITTLGKIATSSSAQPSYQPFTTTPRGGGAAVHVPYRDSKLTRLLQESLGGNTQTVMIACISESTVCFEETLSTLKYASRAKAITRQVHRNTISSAAAAASDPSALLASQGEPDYSELMVKLRDDVRCLRTQLSVVESTNRRLGLIGPHSQPLDGPSASCSDRNALNLRKEASLSQPRAASENRPLWDPSRLSSEEQGPPERKRDKKNEDKREVENSSGCDITASLLRVQKLRAQLQRIDLQQQQRTLHVVGSTKSAGRRILSPAPAESQLRKSFDPSAKIDEFLFH